MPGRSDRWTVPGRHLSISSELAEAGPTGAHCQCDVERLSRGRPRLRVRIRCVQRALRRSTHRIPCWRPRPSHTRPTPTSRASVLPEEASAALCGLRRSEVLEIAIELLLSSQTLRNSRSLESSRGVGWGYTRQHARVFCGHSSEDAVHVYLQAPASARCRAGSRVRCTPAGCNATAPRRSDGCCRGRAHEAGASLLGGDVGGGRRRRGRVLI